MDSNFHISTSRLYLSYFDPDADTHCDFLIALYNNPAIQAANSGVAMTFTDRTAARKQLQMRTKAYAETGYGSYLISLKPEAGTSNESRTEEEFKNIKASLVNIGTVGFRPRHHPSAPTIPDLGFQVLPAYWGKGYATEAVIAILDYFERTRGNRDALGFCGDDNENSKKMFRRIGFEDRGKWLVKGLGHGKTADEGVKALTWARPGMNENLEVYGLGKLGGDIEET